jgi:hypothetical protein
MDLGIYVQNVSINAICWNVEAVLDLFYQRVFVYQLLIIHEYIPIAGIQ